jgi:hypothetical protein
MSSKIGAPAGAPEPLGRDLLLAVVLGQGVAQLP